MGHIILNTGDVVLIDDEDYPLLSRYEWQRAGSAGYAATTMQTLTGKNHTIYMHKLIIGGFWQCDHINGDPLDNRKSNLRRATHQQNCFNKKKVPTRMGKPTSSKYKGVHKYSTSGKYRATIGFNKKLIQLGTYVHEDDAARAYNEKAKELFGEFACLNEVPDRPTATSH